MDAKTQASGTFPTIWGLEQPTGKKPKRTFVNPNREEGMPLCGMSNHALEYRCASNVHSSVPFQLARQINREGQELQRLDGLPSARRWQASVMKR
ncbi:MAG: hypothetical protein LBS40_06000 [Burkholderiales bacterium]|jgi:hypothetical protein|nr:hypothetical protein [Burkholderiales bacterium]